MLQNTGKLTVENIWISIIELKKVDAIVNAANSKLFEGGGVCGAIFEACGPRRLRDKCQEYIKHHG